jgi:hypothetical protein
MRSCLRQVAQARRSDAPFSEFLTATRPSSEIDLTSLRNNNIPFSNRNNNPGVAVRTAPPKTLECARNFCGTGVHFIVSPAADPEHWHSEFSDMAEF